MRRGLWQAEAGGFEGNGEGDAGLWGLSWNNLTV